MNYFRPEQRVLIDALEVNDCISHDGYYMSWTPNVTASKTDVVYKILKIDQGRLYVFKMNKKQALVYNRIVNDSHITHIIDIYDNGYKMKEVNKIESASSK
jgi:hypothetical protein